MFDSWLCLPSQTAQTAEAAKRASRGGMLTGIARLQQQVAAAARQAGPQAPGSVLWPLVSGLKARSQFSASRGRKARLLWLAVISLVVNVCALGRAWPKTADRRHWSLSCTVLSGRALLLAA